MPANRGRPVSWKELAQLAALLVLGWAVAQWMQRAVPLGRDVSASATVGEIARDDASPVGQVAAADLTLVVFTDYQCPACKLANPAMDAAIAADGHVRILYKDYPVFGPASEQAARVAIASAAQGIYPAVHRHLMNDRRRLDETTMRAAVEKAGGDWRRLVADLSAQRPRIEQLLQINRTQAFALGIPGTPAYLAGDFLVIGALDEGQFRRLFEQARRGS